MFIFELINKWRPIDQWSNGHWAAKISTGKRKTKNLLHTASMNVNLNKQSVMLQVKRVAFVLLLSILNQLVNIFGRTNSISKYELKVTNLTLLRTHFSLLRMGRHPPNDSDHFLSASSRFVHLCLLVRRSPWMRILRVCIHFGAHFTNRVCASAVAATLLPGHSVNRTTATCEPQRVHLAHTPILTTPPPSSFLLLTLSLAKTID